MRLKFGKYSFQRQAVESQNQNPMPVASGCLPPGILAPDFTLKASVDHSLSLSELRGQTVILVFYPGDWSRICGDQLALYNEIMPLFDGFNARLLGVSVDTVWSHQAFAEARHFKFSLLADFEPKGSVAQSYGVYDHELGLCQRDIFVIDESGLIRWSYVAAPGVNPGADGILNTLELLYS
jgi:peroxiredoxin